LYYPGKTCNIWRVADLDDQFDVHVDDQATDAATVVDPFRCSKPASVKRAVVDEDKTALETSDQMRVFGHVHPLPSHALETGSPVAF
jgi:hypothetical protein